MITEHKASVIVQGTAEMIDLPINTAHEVAEAYELVEQTLIAYRELRRQITDRGMELLKRREV